MTKTNTNDGLTVNPETYANVGVSNSPSVGFLQKIALGKCLSARRRKSSGSGTRNRRFGILIVALLMTVNVYSMFETDKYILIEDDEEMPLIEYYEKNVKAIEDHYAPNRDGMPQNPEKSYLFLRVDVNSLWKEYDLLKNKDILQVDLSGYNNGNACIENYYGRTRLNTGNLDDMMSGLDIFLTPTYEMNLNYDMNHTILLYIEFTNKKEILTLTRKDYKDLFEQYKGYPLFLTPEQLCGHYRKNYAGDCNVYTEEVYRRELNFPMN